MLLILQAAQGWASVLQSWLTSWSSYSLPVTCSCFEDIIIHKVENNYTMTLCFLKHRPWFVPLTGDQSTSDSVSRLSPVMSTPGIVPPGSSAIPSTSGVVRVWDPRCQVLRGSLNHILSKQGHKYEESHSCLCQTRFIYPKIFDLKNHTPQIIFYWSAKMPRVVGSMIFATIWADKLLAKNL